MKAQQRYRKDLTIPRPPSQNTITSRSRLSPTEATVDDHARQKKKLKSTRGGRPRTEKKKKVEQPWSFTE